MIKLLLLAFVMLFSLNTCFSQKKETQKPIYIVAGDYVNTITENSPMNALSKYAIKKYSVTDG